MNDSFVMWICIHPETLSTVIKDVLVGGIASVVALLKKLNFVNELSVRVVDEWFIILPSHLSHGLFVVADGNFAVSWWVGTPRHRHNDYDEHYNQTSRTRDWCERAGVHLGIRCSETSRTEREAKIYGPETNRSERFPEIKGPDNIGL